MNPILPGWIETLTTVLLVALAVLAPLWATVVRDGGLVRRNPAQVLVARRTRTPSIMSSRYTRGDGPPSRDL